MFIPATLIPTNYGDMSLNKPLRSTEPLPESIVVADLSDESQDVLKNFGLETPALLNNYCWALEDALVEQVEARTNAIKEIKRLRLLLTEHEINH